MFQIRNGRFYADVEPQRLSFAIPEGCWLVTTPPVVAPYFIPLYNKEKNVSIDIWADEGELDDLEEELRMQMSGRWIEKPKGITVNGLEGFCAAYETGQEVMYDVLLDISPYGFKGTDGLGIDRVQLLVHTDKARDIKEVVAGEEVQAVLHGIRVE